MKNYDEILADAKKLHPDAVVSLSNADNTWVITINTNIEVDDSLPERFKGTPAWEAEEQFEGGETVLGRWARKNGYAYDTTVEAAVAYNLLYARSRFVQHEFNKFLEENNIPPILKWDREDEQTREWAVKGLAKQRELEEESYKKFPSE